MKPAFSVLFFTVCAGAGTGLLVWLLLSHLVSFYWLAEVIVRQQTLAVSFIGLGLVTLGLLSSTLHLANPQNAWKAFNRFRTSWLSREGVFSLLFFPLFIAYVAVLFLDGFKLSILSISLNVVSILVALATVYCTGMIYASLKPIRQWHNNLTTPIYLLFALLSGAVILLTINTAFDGQVNDGLLTISLVLLLVTAVFKWLYFWYIGKPSGETINTATGFAGKKVRLLDAGHSSNTFLNNEFIYAAAPKTLSRLRSLMALLVFVLPILLLLFSMISNSQLAIYLCASVMLPGLVVERWLFFAEAKHVVRLYHGDQNT